MQDNLNDLLDEVSRRRLIAILDEQVEQLCNGLRLTREQIAAKFEITLPEDLSDSTLVFSALPLAPTQVLNAMNLNTPGWNTVLMIRNFCDKALTMQHRLNVEGASQDNIEQAMQELAQTDKNRLN